MPAPASPTGVVRIGPCASTRRLAALARRVASALVPLAALWGLAVPPLAALAQGARGYTDSYVVAHRDVAVTDDPVELLIVAEEFDLASRRQQATVLRELVERRLWLQTLGEPQPPAFATVGDVLDARWTESMSALRARGSARVFDVAFVRAEIEPAPPIDSNGNAGRAPKASLTSELAVTNRGALPVAAVELTLAVPIAGSGSAWLATCEEHDLDPIAPSETRVVRCDWERPPEYLQALHDLLAAHTGASPTIAIGDVSFAVAGRRIPHELDVLHTSRSDLDLRRLAVERGGSDTCRERGDCPADPLAYVLALLPWVIVPFGVGIAVARRSARS